MLQNLKNVCFSTKPKNITKDLVCEEEEWVRKREVCCES